jgi:hypothetical protein
MLSRLGQERRHFLSQSAQAREKLFVRETVEIVDVEIDVLRQQRGNHLEIGSRALDPDPLDDLRAMPLEIVGRCLDKGFADPSFPNHPMRAGFPLRYRYKG